ncbi:neuromacin-like protein isoform X2 [Dreissena polymorpha]|uniref:neuromacin-like protein isoform X2 n=1 Tax=Dreissena polymorpha TaxID=45954 RepID=UPI00226527F3|nr:neuromacin-like protein isoform X2 [Dreissena polymorpha]
MKEINPRGSFRISMSTPKESSAESEASGGKQGVLKDCYDQWSRCSTWSSALTGKAWATCDDQCKSKGKDGGTCVEVDATCPVSKKALQCQCYNNK